MSDATPGILTRVVPHLDRSRMLRLKDVDPHFPFYMPNSLSRNFYDTYIEMPPKPKCPVKKAGGPAYVHGELYTKMLTHPPNIRGVPGINSIAQEQLAFFRTKTDVGLNNILNTHGDEFRFYRDVAGHVLLEREQSKLQEKEYQRKLRKREVSVIAKHYPDVGDAMYARISPSKSCGKKQKTCKKTT